MDAQKFRGMWWPPDSPEQKVPGIVEYHPEEGEADLLGTLVVSEEDEREGRVFDRDLEDYAEGILLGETTDSGLVTIADATTVEVHDPSVIGGIGLSNSVYEFTRIYTGGHFEEEPEFNQVSFGFDGLADWFGESRVEWEIPDEDQIRSRYEVKEPKSIKIELSNAEVTFFVDTAVSRSRKTTELNDSVRINIRFSEPLTFPELNTQYLNPLQRYLALATATPVQPTDIDGTVGEDTRVNVLSNIPSHAPENQSVSPVSMLFRPGDVDLENRACHRKPPKGDRRVWKLCPAVPTPCKT